MSANQEYALKELNKEKGFGGMGTTKARNVPKIDMSIFGARKAEIAEQLWAASTDTGFFQLVNHGIPQEQIDEAFDMTARFFDLPKETKAQYPMVKGTNWGWEYKEQVRPSTGTADNKESFQVTVPRMGGLWPTGEELPGFKAVMLAFERANWALGMKVLSCFALKLGFAPDFFTDAHDPTSPEYQSTLRMIHYMAMENAKPARTPTTTASRCCTSAPARVGCSSARARTWKRAASWPGRMWSRCPASSPATSATC
jgi:isopenicillin N synthase-like dioxygenase